MGIFVIVVIVVVVLVVLISRNNSTQQQSQSRQYTPREKRDLEEMRRVASNATPEFFNDGIVWYERTTQGGRRYHLAYWYADGDYKAAVMEGDNPEDRGYPAKSHLFDNREICLKGNSEPRYNSVAEARARAILWALGYSEYLRTGVFPWNEVK